ncbi:hypothetical protein HY638_00240 [Candidatus Woesearchaeota archaeon]|nr:hypothetical protein [Candidatus Woesearchaeota archaeon]
MKGKKGMETIEIIGLVILVLVVTYAMFRIFQNPSAAAYTLTQKEIRSAQHLACRAEGEKAKFEGREITDADKDGYPDGCDFCIGGDDGTDKDGDIIPDDCDDNSNEFPTGKTLKKVCETKSGSWDDKNKQCKINDGK